MTIQKENDSSRLETLFETVDSTAPGAAIASLPDMLNRTDKNVITVGGYLVRIQDEKAWPQEQSFREWVLSEYAIKKSRVYHWMDLYRRLRKASLPPDAVDRVGWSKLALIAPQFNEGGSAKAKKHNRAWVEKAEKLSQKELRAALHAADDQRKADKQDEQPNKRAKSTRMPTFTAERDNATMTEALSLAKSIFHVDDDGAALAKILEFFVQSQVQDRKAA